MIYINNGKRISYTDSSTGYPVVLIHGYLETSESWDGFADKLAEGFRVIAIDLPGHGSSDLIGETQTMEDLATSVKSLLDNLGISDFFLIGHSLGGYITLAFVEMFKSVLSGYCLFHSHPFPDTDEAIEKRKKEVAMAQSGQKELFYRENVKMMFAGQDLKKCLSAVEKAVDIASGIDARGISAVLKGMMLRPSRLNVVEEGEVPFLWILGALDKYIDCNKVRAKIAMPVNASLVILEASGHMGFIEEQDKAVAIVSEFIRHLPGYTKRPHG
ncbi:MAG TPA: alpha/beta fold hydrolase [Bacteroidales bacterium]|nr:alpha/beta fold hydrolase [Bacteroidales bacterium]